MKKLVNAVITGLGLLTLAIPAHAQGAGYPSYPQGQQQQYGGGYQQQSGYQGQAQEQQAPGQQGAYYSASTPSQPPGSYLSGDQSTSQQYGQVSASEASGSTGNNSSNASNEPSQSQTQKKHTGLKNALVGAERLVGTTARVAAPVAGGLMMMRAASTMSPMGMGMMSPYGMGMGMSPMGMGMGMSPYGMGMGMNPMMSSGYGYNPYAMGMGMGTMMMAPALMNAGMNMMSTAGR